MCYTENNSFELHKNFSLFVFYDSFKMLRDDTSQKIEHLLSHS